MGKVCQICNSKESFWNKINLEPVFIAMSFDYGGYALLCRACREHYYDHNVIGNRYWKVAQILGWSENDVYVW